MMSELGPGQRELRPSDFVVSGPVAHWDGQQAASAYHEPQLLLEPPSHFRPKVKRPAILFALTCLSTFWAGTTHWMPAEFMASLSSARYAVLTQWKDGLIYMAAVIFILLMHEMGHFLQTVRNRVPATLPFFIPFPFAMTGTMGAVIGMDSSRGNRKQLFDIGLSGPWAGLIVALPIIWFGIKMAKIVDPVHAAEAFPFGNPLIFKLLTAYLRPDVKPGMVLDIRNPLLMAGWVGMLITGLNMLPVSQLDGGHTIYALFGRKARVIARVFVISAILFIIIFEQYTWTVMLTLVLLLGIDHPPTRDDSTPLGPWRYAIGVLSLAIPVFCFTPLIL
jgi:membrane-associated protease RseP (regulator of RpoE activity)